MKVCGIDLKGSEARIVILETLDNSISVVNSPVRHITLLDHETQKGIDSFKVTMLNYLKSNNIDVVAIIQRPQTGKFSGGGSSFKMEALIQLYEKDVVIINGQTLKTKLKNFDLNQFDVLKKQEGALKAALALL